MIAVIRALLRPTPAPAGNHEFEDPWGDDGYVSKFAQAPTGREYALEIEAADLDITRASLRHRGDWIRQSAPFTRMGREMYLLRVVEGGLKAV